MYLWPDTVEDTIGTEAPGAESAKDSDDSLSNAGTAMPETQDMDNERSASETPPSRRDVALATFAQLADQLRREWQPHLKILLGNIPGASSTQAQDGPFHGKYSSGLC
jgi:hypothetical protein